MKKLILLILLNFTVFFSSYSLESLSLEESLINAAKKGELETIKELISSGVNIRYKDQHGLNALHYAAKCKKQAVLQMILDHIDSMSSITIEKRIYLITKVDLENGQTPLQLAVENKDNSSATII